ncbi:TIGR03943 family putative permease subunit [Aminicella lysinilytica]|uniref:Putative repeat protein (TIGR03943 family) n=1 Tax=Aminicella lysinilytica TaxID=433323 RepID=A0A4R6Q1S1_9FIRM|nr:TIGR03943 family protein [Aminicella lysinilytica]TDP54576.1 putative repeat protein (TIGR03943 family) [Aminicella lysinilytica]
MEIPVYLFTGFLESGKTTFIQDALEGDDFNAGERTLFLLCEEGEEEYHPSRFFGTNVFFEKIENEEDINEKLLSSLQKKHKVERVIVEWNGMWNLDSLYQAMPQEWITYQEMMFADATTFITYNDNMRQLVFDKLKSAEVVVFNRCVRGGFDKMAFHKIVRVANRKSQILYEYGRDDVEMDNIQDPLPFDLKAPVVTIKDEDYAEWYRDINEDQDKYDGLTIKVKGRAVTGGEIPDDKFVFGRHVMTCCVQDIQFAGLVCKWTKEAAKLENGQWVTVKAKIKVEVDPVYENTKGPVLYCTEVQKVDPADPEVATF